MVQFGQLQGFAGINAAGDEQYFTGDNFLSQEMQDSDQKTSSFTLASPATLIVLGSGQYAQGAVVYTDGASVHSMNGGITATKVAALGTTNLTINAKGHRGNIVEIIGANLEDETINLDGVYGFVTTDLADGGAVADNKLQLSFAKFDGTNWLPYVLPAGTYSYAMNRTYTLATAIYNNVFGRIIANGGGTMGGFTEQEIMDIILSQETKWAEVKIDGKQALAAGKEVSLTIDNANSTVVFETVGGTTITGTIKASNGITSSKMVKAGNAGDASIAGVTVSYNGVEQELSKVVIVSANKIKFTVETSSDSLFAGDLISIRGL